MKDELILICDCHSFEHQAIFYKDEETGMLYVSIRLKTYDKFFKRLWAGLKFAFGHTSKYGEWDEFIFQEKDETELSKYLFPPEKLKKISCAFFRSWYNAPGNNTEQGFDKWWKENEEQYNSSGVSEGWICLADKKPEDLQDIWRWKEIFDEPKLDVYQTGRWDIGQYGDGTDSWWKPAFIPNPPKIIGN